MLPNMDATVCPFAWGGLDPGTPCKDCHLCHSCLYYALENHEHPAPVSPAKSDTPSRSVSPVLEQRWWRYEAAGPIYPYPLELEMMTSDEEADETSAIHRRPFNEDPEAARSGMRRRRTSSVVLDNPDSTTNRSESSSYRVPPTPSLPVVRPTHICPSNLEPSPGPDSQGSRRAETSFQQDPRLEGELPQGHAGLDTDLENSSAQPILAPPGERFSCERCDEPDGDKKMIGCDGPNHTNAWFHMSCFGLSVEQELPEHWECPDCRSKRKIKRKPNRSSVQTPASEAKNNSEEPSSSGRKKVNRSWNENEIALVGRFMRDILNAQVDGIYNTEKRFIECSKRLEKHGIDRTEHSIKNWWNRNGRNDFNLDERNIKKPDKMRTSVTSPEKRKQARKRQNNDAAEDDNKANPSSSKRLKRRVSDDSEDDEEADAPPDKLSKRVISNDAEDDKVHFRTKPRKLLKRKDHGDDLEAGDETGVPSSKHLKTD